MSRSEQDHWVVMSHEELWAGRWCACAPALWWRSRDLLQGSEGVASPDALPLVLTLR